MRTLRRRPHWWQRARSGVRPASREEVDSVFRAAPEMYLYGIGDLSDSFWDRAHGGPRRGRRLACCASTASPTRSCTRRGLQTTHNSLR
jgi:hypothetical protein